VIHVGLAKGETIVAGRRYLTRQAATLLKFAKSTSDPKLAAFLVEKAADLKSQVEEAGKPDASPQAPDVEPSSDPDQTRPPRLATSVTGRATWRGSARDSSLAISASPSRLERARFRFKSLFQLVDAYGGCTILNR